MIQEDTKVNITQNGNTVLIEKEGERLELSYIISIN